MNPRTLCIATVFAACFIPACIEAQGVDENALRPQRLEQGPRDRSVRPEVLADFLRVEKFARLAVAVRSRQLETFYRDTAKLFTDRFFESTLSTFPADLFQRPAGVRPDIRLPYPVQLQAKAAEMTPEEVAAAIVAVHPDFVLQLATRRRAIATLQDHRNEVVKLVQADLSSAKAEDHPRAFDIAREMTLTELSDPLFDLALGKSPDAKPAQATLAQFGVQLDTKRPLQEIEKDPAAINTLWTMLQRPLASKPAPPVLVKLLESPDPQVRLHAATALSMSGDSALAAYLPKLLASNDTMLQSSAVEMAFFLPSEKITQLRPSLLPILQTKDIRLRIQTIRNFAKRKDTAVATPLLELMNQPALEFGTATVSQSLVALTGSNFGYDIRNWGPQQPRNAEAIEKFKQWIRDNVPAEQPE